MIFPESDKKDEGRAMNKEMARIITCTFVDILGRAVDFSLN